MIFVSVRCSFFLVVQIFRPYVFESRDLGGSGEKLVDELHVADVIFLIGDNAEKRAELGSLVLLELLSEGAENVLDLGKGDLAGTLLVEDLQAFNVVLLDSGGGEVGLDGGEDGLEVGEGDALDAESISAAGSEDGSVGHVAAQSAEDVAQIKGVNVGAFVGLVENDESILSFSFRHFGG